MYNVRNGCLKLQLSRGGAMLARWSQGPEITDNNRTRAPLINKKHRNIKKGTGVYYEAKAKYTNTYN